MSRKIFPLPERRCEVERNEVDEKLLERLTEAAKKLSAAQLRALVGGLERGRFTLEEVARLLGVSTDADR